MTSTYIKKKEDSKPAWKKNFNGNEGKLEFNSRTPSTKIRWGKIIYPRPGDKPLTRKEQRRNHHLEDKYETESLEISLV
jgi:hypothetical protein